MLSSEQVFLLTEAVDGVPVFRMKPVPPLIRRFTGPPQRGQVVSTASFMVCRRSYCSPHEVHIRQQCGKMSVLGMT